MESKLNRLTPILFLMSSITTWKENFNTLSLMKTLWKQYLTIYSVLGKSMTQELKTKQIFSLSYFNWHFYFIYLFLKQTGFLKIFFPFCSFHHIEHEENIALNALNIWDSSGWREHRAHLEQRERGPWTPSGPHAPDQSTGLQCKNVPEWLDHRYQNFL